MAQKVDGFRLQNCFHRRSNGSGLVSYFRSGMPKETVFRIVAEAYAQTDLSSFTDEQTNKLVSACPALSTFATLYMNYAGSIFEANWQRYKMGNREAIVGKASDFGDLMHATYAPYVDVFRCDSRFGALLQQDISIRSKIAAKRVKLAHVLKACRPEELRDAG